MENDKKILQLFYAGVLADSVYHYSKAGMLGVVAEEKHRQQQQTAGAQLKQLNIHTPEQLFLRFSEIFGCINWNVGVNEDSSVTAEGSGCLLCSIAKRMNTAQPCYMYCINPFKSMLAAMDPAYDLQVKDTLWDGNNCRFESVPIG